MEDPKPTVEYWIRETGETTVAERQTEVYRRLKQYEDAGHIESVVVNHWNERVRCPANVDNRTDELGGGDDWATYCEFNDWAAENGYDLEPAFRRCEHTSLVSSSRLETVRVPLACLAVYVEGTLRGVFPCSTDDGLWTVRYGLALLGSATIGCEHHRSAEDGGQEIDR